MEKQKDNLFSDGVCEPEDEQVKSELYIGCKVIKATPMTSDEFKKLKGVADTGENAPGYKVEYEDGYISWSPSWVFENTYRKISEGEMKLLKQF